MDSKGLINRSSIVSQGKTWLLGRGYWRVLIILGLVFAAAALGYRPSRTYLFLLILVGGGLFLLGKDTHELLLIFPAVALLVPLQFSTGTEVSLNAAFLGAVGLVGYGVVRTSLKRDWRVIHSRLNAPLLALCVISVLSLLAGNVVWDPAVPHPPNMILVQLGQLSIYFLSFFMLWLVAFVVSNLMWLRRLAYALIITGGAGMAMVVVARLLQLGLPLNSITLNMFTVWLIPLSFSQAIHDTRITSWQRHLLIGITLLAVAVVAWTWFLDANWVGGWFPPILALGSFMWLRYPRFRWLIVLVALLVLFVVGIGPFFEVIGFDVEAKWDVSGGSRLTLWRSVLELAAPRPVLGLGIAAYRHYHFLKPLAYGRTLWMRPVVSSHNMFVDLFAQMGILGVACYLWFLIEALLLAWRLYRKNTGFARGYALTAFCALVGIIAADMLAETSLPFVYNMGFPGFRASVVSWMMLGGLVVLENSHEIVMD